MFSARTNNPTIGGSGRAANAIFSDITTTVLLWRKTGVGIFSTAHSINEPPLENLALWTFAGIDRTVIQGGSNPENHLLAFSDISQTPPAGPSTTEPANHGALRRGIHSSGARPQRFGR